MKDPKLTSLCVAETLSLSAISPTLCKKQSFSTVSGIFSITFIRLIFVALNSKEQVCYDDASMDSRFSTEAGQTQHRSVICFPIFSNRGQTFGVVYCASKIPFTKSTIIILSLLCQQASISISNALLFRSVQAGTRENLKMIAAQRDALEAARRSQEDALKATKVWFVTHCVRLPYLTRQRSKAIFWRP